MWWRFILDKPGCLYEEPVIVGSFRTAAMAGKAAGLLMDERGAGWRATVEPDPMYRRLSPRHGDTEGATQCESL